MARVVIVEDVPVLRDLLAQALASSEGHLVVGAYADGHAGLAGIREHAPDLVLLDVLVPGIGGLELARRLKSKKGGPRIVLLTGHEDPATILEAVRLGVEGIVLKGEPFRTLLDGVNRVLAGGAFHCPGTAQLLRRAHERADSPVPLSPREREIVELIATGHSSKEVAARLALSPKTVRNHRQNIMRKLGVHNVASLTRWALEHGLVTRGGSTK